MILRYQVLLSRQNTSQPKAATGMVSRTYTQPPSLTGRARGFHRRVTDFKQPIKKLPVYQFRIFKQCPRCKHKTAGSAKPSSSSILRREWTVLPTHTAPFAHRQSSGFDKISKNFKQPMTATLPQEKGNQTSSAEPHSRPFALTHPDLECCLEVTDFKRPTMTVFLYSTYNSSRPRSDSGP
jgi:hypothetical protein